MTPDMNAMLDGNFFTPQMLKEEEALKAKEVMKFKPLSMKELLSMPPKRWIINNVLGAGDIAMIYGAPGSGKTFIVVDLIFSACLARQWAMRFDIPAPLNVAYCAGEGVSCLPSRFGAAAIHYDAHDLANFTFYAVTPSLFYEDGLRNDIESIEKFMLEWKERQAQGEAEALDILIIDTLHSATAGADENSARDMGMVVDLCRRAARVLGCAVLLVHHANKAGTGERGSSALRGAMDLMIETKPTASKYSMECAKLKDGEKWKEQTFDLTAIGDSVRVWWDKPLDGEQGDQRKTETAQEIIRLLSTTNGKLTTRQISEALGLKPNSTNDVLARLVREKAIERSQTDRGTWCFSLLEDPPM